MGTAGFIKIYTILSERMALCYFQHPPVERGQQSHEIDLSTSVLIGTLHVAWQARQSFAVCDG